MARSPGGVAARGATGRHEAPVAVRTTGPCGVGPVRGPRDVADA